MNLHLFFLKKKKRKGVGILLTGNHTWGEPVTAMLVDYLGNSTTARWTGLSCLLELAAAEARRGALGATRLGRG